MEEIVVLLSTYNGEKYLKEQMDSLLAQINISTHILVRDDGSTDKTLSILDEYHKQYPDRIEIITGENVGWKRSYLIIAEYASKNYADKKYFAFSDQDDVWLPNKLEIAIDNIKKYDDSDSVLYCSNLFLYKNGIKGEKIRSGNIIPSFKNCLVKNYATGCTIAFNLSLLKMICSSLPNISIAHDYWFYMVAMLCGEVIIDPEAYILYRQHDNNQIGIRRNFTGVWKRRFKDLTDPQIKHLREKTAKELLNRFEPCMHPEAKDATQGIANYKSSLATRVKILFDQGYTLGKWDNDFWLKIKILCGLL